LLGVRLLGRELSFAGLLIGLGSVALVCCG
jgi:hypothetical protein